MTMKFPRLLLTTVLALAGILNVMAQDIPTGLVRFKNARTTTAYLTSKTAGSAVGASKITKASDLLAQVWIVMPTSGGYTIRNAKTAQYLQPEFGTPDATKTTLYIQQDPNQKTYLNISSKSDFSGLSCMNLGNNGTQITKWNNSNDTGSMWKAEAVTDVTEDEVRTNLRQVTGIASELSEGKYYRIISYYGRALQDTEDVGGDMSTEPVDPASIAQYWTLTKDGDKWKFQNVLTERFIVQQKTTSAPFHTSSPENVAQFNLDVSCIVKPIEDPWDSQWTIAFPGDSKGFHDASSQSHHMVLWSTDAAASVWSFQECEVSQEAIDAARATLQEFNETIGRYNDIVKQKSTLQAALNQLFTDKACTTLKENIATLTDDQLAANEYYTALTDDQKAMVLKIKNNTWQQFTSTKTDYSAGYEKFFRIADYQIYSNYQDMCSSDNFTMSNTFGRLSGPTGIVANKGDIIYVYVNGPIDTNASLQLEAVSTTGVAGNHPTGSLTALKAGLNLFQFTEQKMLYILYEVKQGTTGRYSQLSRFDDMTVHIEGGQLNGYWDATRGMTDADWALLQQDLLKASPFLNLKTEHLVFQMDADAVKKAEPKDMEGLMRIWDKIPENEDRYMGVEDFEGRYRNIWNAFSGASSYMHATTYGTWYTESTLPTIMNYANMRKGGNLWGPSHEMGHNHQGSINVIGTTESSNNMFSNINVFEQGITASRRHYPKDNFTQMASQTPWLQRNIWLTTSMFFQLYLYFHAMHHDDQFLPNLFRNLRKSPINKGTWNGSITYQYKEDGVTKTGTGANVAKGSKDYLHLAKKICDAAQADLSEFFEAYGMFIPVSQMHVGDYSNYVVTTTQKEIDDAKAYMQKYEKKLNNIMFIDDRVIKKKAIEDNIFEAIPASDGYRIPINDENPFLMANARSTYVGGDYESFTDDAAPVTDDYYTLNATGKVMTFQGTNYAGHKFYDADGNFIWATNEKKVTLPKCVLDIGLDNITVKTAMYNMEDVICTDQKPDAITSVLAKGQDASQPVFDLAGRRISKARQPGLYLVRGKKVLVK